MPEAKDSKADFLKTAAKYKKSFKKARTVDANSFSNPEMEDGAYNCRLTAVRFGQSPTDKAPYVSFNFVVVDGDYKGQRPSIFHKLSSDDKLEYLVKDCKRLGIETDEMELEEMIDALSELAADLPYVKVDVKNKDWTNPKTKKVEQRLNVYVNKLLEDFDPEDGEEDAEEEVEEDTEEEVEEEEEAAEEEEEAAEIPEKGNAVKYKPKGSRKASEFTVIKVYLKDEKVDLKDDAGKTIKGVPFADVELIFDDED